MFLKINIKIEEVKQIIHEVNVDVVEVKYPIDEIQTEDVNNLVRDKLLKAFKPINRPVFVEHTGLYIKSLNGFSGGLTQIFWDKLQADKFSSILGSGEDANLVAKTIIF